MKSAHSLHHWILCIILITGPSLQASLKQEMTLVDLSQARFITSPLKSGSNSTELLVPDYSKSPSCVVTLPQVVSWILIDIGYPVSGLAQIRLFTDIFLENSHDFLAHIEVDLAEYLSPSALDKFTPDLLKDFTRCDTTGTVSKDTSNAVIDCASPMKTRWILLKKVGQLNLCFVQILQNTVKPDCFHRISPTDSLFRRAKESLSVFRSLNFVRFLDCLRKCDKEVHCEAVAFIWHREEAGMCQFLRYKASSDDFLCDDSCELRINRCHIGDRMEVMYRDVEDLIKLPEMGQSEYALSVEVNGEVRCGQGDCARTSLWIRGSDGTDRYCGFIDTRTHRVLINMVLLCQAPVRGPQYLVTRHDPSHVTRPVKFTSIGIRVAKEGSLFLYEESGETTVARTSRVTSKSKSTSIFPTVKSSSPSYLTFSARVSTTHRDNMVDPGTSVPSYPSSAVSTEPTHGRHSPSPTMQTGRIVTHVTMEEHTKLKIMTEVEIMSTENKSFLSGRTRMEGKDVPFLWLILLIFGFILVIVTLVVVLVTYVEGRRKRKHWNIPEGGLFPSDGAEESVTMATSLQMSSIIR